MNVVDDIHRGGEGYGIIGGEVEFLHPGCKVWSVTILEVYGSRPWALW